MAEVVSELPVFLVPLQKSSILIPNATVAEIIPYEPLQRVEDTPDWFLGYLAWRGVQVPVVSFEMLSVDRASFSLVSVSSASLVVLRAIGGNAHFRYFALVAQALPRLMRVSSEALMEIDEEIYRTELLRARLGEDVVAIPDLDMIEDAIAETAHGDQV
ncbi:MAG: chemotaxis protein CheW [Pseudomonadales bacterium]|nr:chemotaxis protein CheW [Pseudomonadales bacterium]